MPTACLSSGRNLVSERASLQLGCANQRRVRRVRSVGRGHRRGSRVERRQQVCYPCVSWRRRPSQALAIPNGSVARNGVSWDQWHYNVVYDQEVVWQVEPACVILCTLHWDLQVTPLLIQALVARPGPGLEGHVKVHRHSYFARPSAISAAMSLLWRHHASSPIWLAAARCRRTACGWQHRSGLARCARACAGCCVFGSRFETRAQATVLESCGDLGPVCEAA